MEVRKREKETTASLLYRFSRKVKRSGVLLETRKRNFYKRPISRRQRRLSALYREKRKKEIEKAKKMGEL